VKIDKRIGSTTASKVSSARGRAADKTGNTPAQVGGDSLTLTESSTRIRALEAELAHIDITDIQKIESVKEALASGSFEVHAEVVADRLIDETKETLRKRPRRK
jgi:negative regulator of flagellin synthesis FlgM